MVSGRVVLAADRLVALDDRLSELQHRLARLAAGQASSRADVREARVRADRQRARTAAAQVLLSSARRGTSVRTIATTRSSDPSSTQSGTGRVSPPVDQYWRVLVDQARRSGWRNWTEALCRVAAAALPSVRGVAVSAFTEQLPCPMAASDARTQRIEELQQVLGEGPAMTACRNCHPVDVRVTDQFDDGWLAWAQAVQRSGVHAVWSFPHRWPGVGCAAVTFYRGPDSADGHRTGAEGIDEYSEATVLSRLAGQTLRLDLDRHNSSGLDVLETVHVAAGMLAERVGMTAVDAFARIRAYAFAADRQLMDVAISIIIGGVRLDEQF
jgi:hypothetical protein